MMERLTGRAWAAFITVLVVIIFVCAHLLVQPRLAPARLDFTAERLYTLSAATDAALARIAEPVELTFVYTRRVGQDYPAIRAYAARVREMLAAYEARAGARLIVREIDPAPFSEAEDEALAAGITAVDTDTGDPLYFGIIGRNTVDDIRVIPFLAPEREGSLEYDLTRLISRLDDPSPATVGVLSSLSGMRGDGSETGYLVLREMAKGFRIRPVEPDFVTLPEDLDALLIAHPPELGAYQYWLIDQFLLREGRVMFLADPASRAGLAGDVFRIEARRTASDFGPLGEAWGVQLSEAVLADAANALPVQVDAGEGRSSVAGQPLFIAAPPANMNEESVVTAELSRSVNFGVAGALEVTPAGGLSATSLIKTGPNPAFIDARRALTDMPPGDVIAAYEARDGAEILAARLAGRFTSAFPNGAPPVPLTGDPVIDELTRAATAEAAPHIAESTGTGILIAVGDADLLDDGFYVNPGSGAPVADNAVFILNALDALTGVENLLSLRSRARAQRPMERVEALREDAQARVYDEQARLEARLAETEARLAELQQLAAQEAAFGGDLEAALSPDERAELYALRTEIIETRARLRAIERDFRREIDALEGTLKAINIWGGPVLILVLAGLLRLRRGRRPA